MNTSSKKDRITVQDTGGLMLATTPIHPDAMARANITDTKLTELAVASLEDFSAQLEKLESMTDLFDNQFSFDEAPAAKTPAPVAPPVQSGAGAQAPAAASPATVAGDEDEGGEILIGGIGEDESIDGALQFDPASFEDEAPFDETFASEEAGFDTASDGNGDFDPDAFFVEGADDAMQFEYYDAQGEAEAFDAANPDFSEEGSEDIGELPDFEIAPEVETEANAAISDQILEFHEADALPDDGYEADGTPSEDDYDPEHFDEAGFDAEMGDALAASGDPDEFEVDWNQDAELTPPLADGPHGSFQDDEETYPDDAVYADDGGDQGFDMSGDQDAAGEPEIMGENWNWDSEEIDPASFESDGVPYPEDDGNAEQEPVWLDGIEHGGSEEEAYEAEQGHLDVEALLEPEVQDDDEEEDLPPFVTETDAGAGQEDEDDAVKAVESAPVVVPAFDLSDDNAENSIPAAVSRTALDAARTPGKAKGETQVSDMDEEDQGFPVIGEEEAEDVTPVRPRKPVAKNAAPQQKQGKKAVASPAKGKAARPAPKRAQEDADEDEDEVVESGRSKSRKRLVLMASAAGAILLGYGGYLGYDTYLAAPPAAPVAAPVAVPAPAAVAVDPQASQQAPVTTPFAQGGADSVPGIPGAPVLSEAPADLAPVYPDAAAGLAPPATGFDIGSDLTPPGPGAEDGTGYPSGDELQPEPMGLPPLDPTVQAPDFTSGADTPDMPDDPASDPSVAPVEPFGGVESGADDFLSGMASGIEAAAEGGLDALLEAANPTAPADLQAALAQFVKAEDHEALRSELTEFRSLMDGFRSEMDARDTAIKELENELAEAEAQAERAEQLALAQNQMLVEVVKVQDKVKMAESLIVDLSRRVAAIETTDPADRVAVERSLEHLDSQVKGLIRDVGMVARVAINGSPVAVNTVSQPKTAGGDPVFAEGGSTRKPGLNEADVPQGAKKGDFIEGWGTVLDVMPTSDGSSLFVMENGSVIK